MAAFHRFQSKSCLSASHDYPAVRHRSSSGGPPGSCRSAFGEESCRSGIDQRLSLQILFGHSRLDVHAVDERASSFAQGLIPSYQTEMMTFGFSTLIDALSWVIALTLGLKVVATLVLLRTSSDFRDRSGWGAALWWATKITPVIAAPCFTWIALLQGIANLIWVGIAMMLFVVIAVPLKICQRRNRIAGQMSAKPFV